jgi:hypothetical protein
VDFLALAEHFRSSSTEPDPLIRIKAIGRAYVDFARRHPNHYRMMFLTAHPPVPAEERQIEPGNLQEDAWAILVAAVAEAQEGGDLRSDLGTPGEVAQDFFAGVHGLLALHLTLADDPWIDWSPIEAASERMMEALIRGYSASSVGSSSPSRKGR